MLLTHNPRRSRSRFATSEKRKDNFDRGRRFAISPFRFRAGSPGENPFVWGLHFPKARLWCILLYKGMGLFDTRLFKPAPFDNLKQTNPAEGGKRNNGNRRSKTEKNAYDFGK
jgi:hypothetical protein